MTKPTPYTPYYWLEYGQHGASSMAMWKCLMDRPEGNSHPYDSDDFSRCYKLLEMVPSFKDHLEKLRILSPQWSALVDIWAVLTDMYENKNQNLSNLVYKTVKRT